MSIRLLVAAGSVVLCVSQVQAQAASAAAHDPGQAEQHNSVGDEKFRQMDANGDGIISRSEFDDFNSRLFDQMDANKDGKLTLDEMTAGHNMAAGNSATSHLDLRFNAADVNHDGGLDRKEAEAMPMLSMYFDEVDANKDGKVTRQEYFDAMPLLHKAKQDKANAL